MNLACEECTDREHDLRRHNLYAGRSDDAAETITGQQQIVDALLQQRQAWLRLQDSADGLTVEDAVGLRTCRANRRPLA